MMLLVSCWMCSLGFDVEPATTDESLALIDGSARFVCEDCAVVLDVEGADS